MADMDRKKNVGNSPFIPMRPKVSLLKTMQEAPYRALVGVELVGKTYVKCQERTPWNIRCQTGLTNRWRLPDSLYGDLLGSSQALKAVNAPFNQHLVSRLCSKNPSINPALISCKGFADMNERNWSLLKKVRKNMFAAEEDEERLPPVG